MGIPVLPDPPKEYDQQYVEQLLRVLQAQFRAIDNPGRALHTRIKLTDLPTSSAGLVSGEVWVDTGAGNVLKIVP